MPLQESVGNAVVRWSVVSTCALFSDARSANTEENVAGQGSPLPSTLNVVVDGKFELHLRI